MSEAARARRWGTGLLAAGALAGLAAAGADLVAGARPDAPLASDSVASVNGVPIARAEYERALAALAADRREGLQPSDRAHVLERLVDEELLLQRALELDLPRLERRARGLLVAHVIQGVVATAAGEPGEEELRSFYEAHRDRFHQPGRVRVEGLWVRAEPERSAAAAEARAREAARRLRAGALLESVARELGDPGLTAPGGWLAPAKLRDYLGPTAARSALALEPGEVSEPIRSVGGYQILRLRDREPLRVPPFEVIRGTVAAELRRAREEEALRDYLKALRADAVIHRAIDPP